MKLRKFLKYCFIVLRFIFTLSLSIMKEKSKNSIKHAKEDEEYPYPTFTNKKTF